VGPVLTFEHVTKTFTLEHDRPRSFKEAFVGLFRGERGVSRELLVALDDVSFEVAPGTALALVGPNGTGKSTVLKLAAGILEPTSGTVTTAGRVAALLELGAGFHPDLSGRENLYLNGSLMGLSRREVDRRFGDIVDFAELERFIDMPVKHYSSGMYMRLAFAAAIHVDPELLLVDEVLAVGDQAFQNKCRDRIALLRKAGITIILVSHAAEAVRELCDRAIWLEDGLVQADGPAGAVMDGYEASVVAREEARYAAEHDTEPVLPGPVLDRWGSGEVEILDLAFLGPDGEPRHVLFTGEPATVRLDYVAHRRVAEPVFGLAIHRHDGIHVTGPNTLEAGLEIAGIEGPGRVTYAIQRLPLLPGSYEVSAAVYDKSCSHPYDHHHRRFALHVRGGTVRERLGLVSLPATWSHQPGGAADAATGSAEHAAAGAVEGPAERPADQLANGVAGAEPRTHGADRPDGTGVAESPPTLPASTARETTPTH
jgi:lipopolysaccharide transport system ATP-binding protein